MIANQHVATEMSATLVMDRDDNQSATARGDEAHPVNHQQQDESVRREHNPVSVEVVAQTGEESETIQANYKFKTDKRNAIHIVDCTANGIRENTMMRLDLDNSSVCDDTQIRAKDTENSVAFARHTQMGIGNQNPTMMVIEEDVLDEDSMPRMTKVQPRFEEDNSADDTEEKQIDVTQKDMLQVSS